METKIDFAELRRSMTEHHLRTRGIRDERILNAFASIPREQFVPPDLAATAYHDGPLPIGSGQTISQPYIVALMTQLLDVKKGTKVLEIGTGSGYQAAILAALGCDVFSVERNPELAERASALLVKLGFSVHILTGDGTIGWREHAPFDRIIVTAAAPRIPESLADQLIEGGIIVIPVGTLHIQDLIKGIKKNEKILEENHGGCQFVPLKGKEGWQE
jgi:protein-L-isoaspartate(D-aspartate) O-methyltransferase